MRSGRSTALVAGTLFFFSGALGLGYELIWIRKASLVVGASQIALSTVLASFFLGLGLGGLVVGRLRAAGRAPLALYGFFEIGIGAYALLFPVLFAAVERSYGALYPVAAVTAAGLFALRFALLFALFLPPTFLMGGTLPLLLDGLVGDERSIGFSTSLLYGTNILGAVGGVLVTSYLAIPRLGMNGTSRAAGAGNLLLGALALAFFRRVPPPHVADERAAHPRARFAVLAFACGTLAIAWQVCHARFFSLLDVTTVYTTAMLLAVWLLALAAGSLLLAPALRGRVEPLRAVALAQFLVPLAGLFAFRAVRLVDFSFILGARRAAGGEVIPIETLQGLPRAAFWSETADAIFFAPLFQIGLVVFVPVVLMGVCLPALIAAATPRPAALRSIAGALVFWNTLGAALGAAVAGYLLLPLLGLHASLVVLGFGSLAIGLAAGRPAASSRAAGGCGALACLAFAFVAPDLTRDTIERLGYGRAADAGDLVEVVEDPVGTTYVYESDDHVLLAQGGVAFASAAKHGLSAQSIQGHLPILFFPGEGLPRRCLGIGIGSGLSFGALLMYGISSLDVVDISPGLVDLSLRRFAPYNHGLADDERVRFHFDDGRHFVARAADGVFDVISMEPPPPRADGVFSLYSTDFYREVRRVLGERGVFMQWLPLYRVTPDDARGILRTQVAVFPETFVVKQADEDFVLLSFKRSPVFDIARLRDRVRVFAGERMLAGRKWSARAVHEIASFEGVASALVAGPAALSTLDGPGPFADDRMELSYGSGDRWLLRRYRSAVSRISFAVVPESPFTDLARYFDPALDPELAAKLERERAAALEFYNAVDPERLTRWRAMAAQEADVRRRVRGHLALAAADDVRLWKGDAFTHLRAAIEIDPHDAAAEDLALARRIVLDHFAVYHGAVASFVVEMRSRFPEAPLVRAAGEAFDAAERLERERRARYLFPER